MSDPRFPDSERCNECGGRYPMDELRGDNANGGWLCARCLACPACGEPHLAGDEGADLGNAHGTCRRFGGSPLALEGVGALDRLRDRYVRTPGDRAGLDLARAELAASCAHQWAPSPGPAYDYRANPAMWRGEKARATCLNCGGVTWLSREQTDLAPKVPHA